MANETRHPWGVGTGINSLADMIRELQGKKVPLQTSALSEMVKGSSPFGPPPEFPSGMAQGVSLFEPLPKGHSGINPLNPVASSVMTDENADIFRPASVPSRSSPGGFDMLSAMMTPPPGPQAIPPTVQEPLLSPGMTKGLDSLGPILAAAGLLYATQRGTGQRPAPVGRTGGGTMNWPMPSENLAKLIMAQRRG